jgi:hypothetical protein
MLVLIFLILASPELQRQLKVFKTHKLYGAFTPAGEPFLSDSTWFLGIYQKQQENKSEESIGFRNDLVRLRNQIDFSLFGISHGREVIYGKQGYLFFKEGIDNFTGKNCLTPSFYRARVGEYKKLQEYLKKRHQILLLLVITPDKAHFYPEYIPSRFLKKSTPETHYQVYTRLLKESNVMYIDFNSFFIHGKDNSRYNLYPKYGSHWSLYGSVTAFDSLNRYISLVKGIEMPARVTDSVFVTNRPRGDDRDFVRLMNLIGEPSHPELFYETYHFTSAKNTCKPRVLFVGDSFFWQWDNEGIIKENFTNPNFWYYNKTVFPESKTHYINAYDLDFREQVLNRDMIILIQTMGGSCRLGYGFLERAVAELLYPEKLHEQMNTIRNNRKWMAEVEKKAKLNKEPVDRTLYFDAINCVIRQVENKK